MWRFYDEPTVRRELEVLAQHGMDTVRAFCFWPDLQPAPDRVDADGLALLRRFCATAGEYGLGVVPTFLVGHMSGQNWDVPWRGGRDLYTDGWMLGQQAYYISEVVRALRDEPAVVGWLISNEMPLYADEHRGGAPHHADVLAWARICVHAVRAGGSALPVSLGDGAWGLETTGRDNGYRLRELAGVVDFAGPHVYAMGDDLTRVLLRPAWVCELAHTAGQPVLLEEFGVTSTFTSDRNAAHHYRVVLASTLLAGATGWIAWNNTDFDLPQQDPYRFRPYELGFGLTTPDGTPKPALAEIAAFRAALEATGALAARRAPTDTAVLISSFLDEDHPMTVPEDSVPVAECGFQAYIAARSADLGPAVVRERDLPTIGDVRLLVVPCAKALLQPTWHELERRAEAGATVYASYFAGVDTHQRGPWWRVDELFGVENDLFYGVTDPVPDVVEWEFTADFGDLRPGDRLRFPAGGSDTTRSRLPVRAAGARVVAVDADGQPALLVREVGAGRLVLSTVPVEAFAAYRPNANPDDSWRLYRALAAAAGVEPAATVDDPRVHVDRLVEPDSVWLVNTSRAEVKAALRLAAPAYDLRTGEALGATVQLGPFEVLVARR
jgi:endo-1,4-beta-mannosidase